MAGAKRIIYWDTCIWMAWVRDEKRPDPNDMAGIQEQVKQFHAGEITIATSVLTLGEMLDLSNQLSASAHRKFQLFFRRSDIIRISADIRVAELTQKLRDFYWIQSRTDGLPTLEFGDAVHLASAIHYNVHEFITFDSRDVKKPSKAKRGILPLSGNVAGHRLLIAKPVAKEPELGLTLPHGASEAEKRNVQTIPQQPSIHRD